MQILEFDQFEFPYASSEENLRLFIESRERILDATTFLARCLSHEERVGLLLACPSKCYEESEWMGEIRTLLTHFTPELAKELTGGHVTALLVGLDDHSLLITTQFHFVLYQWSSAA